MKDLFLLAGFGMGLITGAMLYKYSQETRKAVNNGEKTIMKEAEKMGQKAEKSVKKLGNKAEQNVKKLGDKAEKGIEKVEQVVKKGNKAIQKQMSK